MSDPLASIVILGWGSEPYIATCLAALRNQTYTNHEIIVVDNGSPDQTAVIVSRDFPEVQLIRTGRNLGVAGGNNVGLKAARGDVLVLINADVEVHPDWLEQLVRAIQSDTSIGIAGAKLLYPDGTIQFAGGCITRPQGHSDHLGWHEADQGQRDNLGDVDFITGASMAISRRALEQVGYQDEKFFPIDYEDPDYCYRMRAAGFRVVLVPQAVAVHHESSSTGATSLRRVLPLEAGRIRFVAKHWSTSQLRHEFLPAELEFLRTASAPYRRMMRWIYLKILGELNDLAAWRVRLGKGPAPESLAVLTEVINRLRHACLSEPEQPVPGEVAPILSAWFDADGEAISEHGRFLLSSLYKTEGYVEPHWHIAWPAWPPGIRPKIVALFQKIVRRLLRWYINPIIEQQNAVNASLLRTVEMLAQEIIVLQNRSGNAPAANSQKRGETGGEHPS